ncbi:MAG: helix-turn-helix transcriptional regulator [Clostridiales bacterium]|nr:helix-turn-helix transcriptional regulator [Clostridiales bacterium]
MRTISEIRDKFVEILRELMYEKGITKITFLASETGIPRTTISTWMSKKSVPQIDSLDKLANYFNVTTDFLLGREN